MTLRNLKQIAAFRSPKRFKKLLAGRRGGKSFGLLEECIKRAWNSPHGSECAYIGPTNQHAKDLGWDFFKTRFRKLKWDFEPKVSERVFLLPGNRKFYVIGAEKIDRVRGHKLWHAGLDEVAYFNTPMDEVWSALRPTLSDLKGTCTFGTTPNGKGSDCYDFYQKHSGDDWDYHHWTTLENPYIDPQEIEDARRDLDEKAFNQEYNATWETYEGRAYYNFDESVHVRRCSDFDNSCPITLSFDFNVNPTTLLISQYINRTKIFRMEYSFADSSTERTVGQFISDFKGQLNFPVNIRGDSAGNQRKSTTGKSDYQYIFEALKAHGIPYTYQVPTTNPAIIDRVNAVNGWLKPIIGPPRVMIDPSLKNLIKDLSGQKLDGRLPSPDNNLGHKADAMGYDIHWELLSEKRPQSISRRM